MLNVTLYSCLPDIESDTKIVDILEANTKPNATVRTLTISESLKEELIWSEFIPEIWSGEKPCDPDVPSDHKVVSTRMFNAASNWLITCYPNWNALSNKDKLLIVHVTYQILGFPNGKTSLNFNNFDCFDISLAILFFSSFKFSSEIDRENEQKMLEIYNTLAEIISVKVIVFD